MRRSQRSLTEVRARVRHLFLLLAACACASSSPFISRPLPTQSTGAALWGFSRSFPSSPFVKKESDKFFILRGSEFTFISCPDTCVSAAAGRSKGRQCCSLQTAAASPQARPVACCPPVLAIDRSRASWLPIFFSETAAEAATAAAAAAPALERPSLCSGALELAKQQAGGHLALQMRAHTKKSHSRLGRPQAHRKALLRNLATQLIRHGSIVTTAAKGKELSRLIDSKIVLAKKGGLHNYRQALGFFYDKKLTRELFRQAPNRFCRRNSGFCRRTRLPFPRLGDAAKMCRIELID
ncbi:hypothetical protein Efla_004834 [Eimeria flavescens]